MSVTGGVLGEAALDGLLMGWMSRLNGGGGNTHEKKNPKSGSDESFPASCPHRAKLEKHRGKHRSSSSRHTETHHKMDECVLCSISQACTGVEAG